MRGDTDFTQCEHLDRWDKQGVQFVFGIDAMPNLYETAEKLPPEAWKVLVRRVKHQVKTEPRQRPENVKQQVVEERKYKDIRLVNEHVAEFTYQPGKCQKAYRVVVVGKDLEVYEGQKKLFDDSLCFFYITNVEEKPVEEIVFAANDRCNRENLHSQLKSGVRSLTAPVDSLLSNWAYMVMASLAWSLKAWSALILPEDGRWQEKHREEKRQAVADGVCHLPSGDDEYSGADRADRGEDHLPLVGLEPLAARVLPPLGPTESTTAMLKTHP